MHKTEKQQASHVKMAEQVPKLIKEKKNLNHKSNIMVQEIL